MDLVIVMDASGSVGFDGGWRPTIQYSTQLINLLPISRTNVQVAVVRFSDGPRTIVELGEYSDEADLRNRIENTERPGGRTNIPSALDRAYEILKGSSRSRPDVPHVVIFITDGNPDLEKDRMVSATTRLKDYAEVIAIGVGNKVSYSVIHMIAKRDDWVIQVNKFTNLTATLTKVLQETCVVSVLPTPTPVPPPKGGKYTLMLTYA